MSKRIDRFPVQPGVEVNMGCREWEGHKSVETAVSRQRDRLATLQDLPYLYQAARQMSTVGHKAITVIDEDLEATSVEFAHDVSDDTRRRCVHGGSDGDREVCAVMTVVGEVPTAEVLDLRLLDRPACLNRRLSVIEEVGNDGLARQDWAAKPQRKGHPRPKLL